ncbi:MerR family transcriptional regulator [Shinella sp.]|uniref:MerR family transcriptional regulator n=1 Tax=Shinella sp. TaxID=1870904 RepID=UPI003F6F14D3
MRNSAPHLNPSEAARRLGISAKALRLYERHGLLAIPRTAAGWRAYGPQEMARADEIVALRKLGLSLAQVKRALTGDADSLDLALATHQAHLERQLHQIAETVRTVQATRASLAAGTAPAMTIAGLLPKATITLDLPWPWGGERFELPNPKPITYITGPLGSGKTRLAHALAETIPHAAFIGLDRLDNGCAAAMARLESDPALKARLEPILLWLAEEGATVSPALTALLVTLEAAKNATLVIDMVEQGLDQATQEAVRSHLRNRCLDGPPLFLLTRSSSMLDLDDMTADESILFCPANHDVPFLVAPHPGARGYEAVATCLATPAVRSRTEGVIAWRPNVA